MWVAGVEACRGRERRERACLLSSPSPCHSLAAEAYREQKLGPCYVVSGTLRIGPASATQQPGPTAPASLSPSGLSKSWEDQGCKKGLWWSCKIRS